MQESHTVIFFFQFSVAAGTVQKHYDITAILCNPVRAHGTKLWIRNTYDRTAYVHETSATLFNQRSKLRYGVLCFSKHTKCSFASNTLKYFTQMVFSFCFTEWNLIRSSILSYVAVLNVYFGYCRLDDLLGTLQSHIDQKNH